MIDAPLLNLKEAARLLGCSPKGVRVLIDRTRRGKPGGIRFCQVGRGRIRFRREWLDEFVDEHTTYTPTPLTRPKSHGANWGLAR